MINELIYVSYYISIEDTGEVLKILQGLISIFHSPILFQGSSFHFTIVPADTTKPMQDNYISLSLPFRGFCSPITGRWRGV
jgi:hypothetical protein